jgi:hypothetical protein
MDKQRVGSFLEHNLVECWPALLAASCAVVESMHDRRSLRHGSQQMLRKVSRDIWSALNMLLGYEPIAKLILIDGRHATTSLAQLRSTLSVISTMTSSGVDIDTAMAMDPGATLDGNVNKAGALLSIWCRKLGIEMDCEHAMRLKNARLARCELQMQCVATVSYPVRSCHS